MLDKTESVLDCEASTLDRDESSGLDSDFGGLDTDAAAHDEPDPFAAIEYKNLESDSAAESSAILEAFRRRAKEEEKRFREATDSEFWFAVCFQTREQKNVFLAALRWDRHGNKYLDGVRMAREQNIVLPKSSVRFQGERVDRKLVDALGTIIKLDGGE